MKTEYIAIIIMIIVTLVLLYYGFVHFIKNKGLKNEPTQSSIDIDTLIDSLGGLKNITDVTSSPSKLSVILKDQSLAQIAVIQSLGASGIVEGKDTLSIIFGKQSNLIANDIKNRM